MPLRRFPVGNKLPASAFWPDAEASATLYPGQPLAELVTGAEPFVVGVSRERIPVRACSCAHCRDSAQTFNLQVFSESRPQPHQSHHPGPDARLPGGADPADLGRCVGD